MEDKELAGFVFASIMSGVYYMPKIIIIIFFVLILIVILNFKKILKKESNEEKGDKYEKQISNYFRNLGYCVYEKGLIEKRKDGGIDLITYDNEKTEIILIQCKNWQKKEIKQEDIRKFIGDSYVYINKEKNRL